LYLQLNDNKITDDMQDKDIPIGLRGKDYSSASFTEQKLLMSRVLRDMFTDFKKEGTIGTLTSYNKIHPQINYNYLRKIEQAGVIEATSTSRITRKYIWKRDPNNPDFEDIAKEVLNYRSSESYQSVKSTAVIAPKTKFTTEQLINLVLTLQKNGVENEKIPDLINEIKKILI
jgi:hypothetical protein